MRQPRTGQPPGERHPSAKLTRAVVLEIRRRTQAGEPQKGLAFEFGVTPSTISKVANGKSWAHLGPVKSLPKAQGSQRPTARLAESDIAPICLAIMRGVRIRALARHYDVSPSTISKIWHGITWKHVRRPTLSEKRKRVWEQ